MKTVLVSIIVLLCGVANSQAEMIYLSLAGDTPVKNDVFGNEAVILAKFKLTTMSDAVNISNVTVTVGGSYAVTACDLIRGSSATVLGTQPENDSKFSFTGLNLIIGGYCTEIIAVRAHLSAIDEVNVLSGTIVNAGLLGNDAIQGVNLTTGLAFTSGSQSVIGYNQTLVPEPSTLVLLVSGLGALCFAVWRKKTQN